MCYCSKSAEEGQGLAEKKRKENQRGLGTLPYGNFIKRTAGRNDEFRPCVRTWAVLAILAILVFDTPGGCVDILIFS
ncbi:hypothetical protein AALB52_14530 [Lachnospiraceae bacterium 38-14]